VAAPTVRVVAGVRGGADDAEEDEDADEEEEDPFAVSARALAVQRKARLRARVRRSDAEVVTVVGQLAVTAPEGERDCLSSVRASERASGRRRRANGRVFDASLTPLR